VGSDSTDNPVALVIAAMLAVAMRAGTRRRKR